MTTKKSKRDLELENAELRGRVKALEEICAAYRAKRAPAPTVNPMPFIPYVPPPAAAPFRLGEVWCGTLAPGGAAGNACAAAPMLGNVWIVETRFGGPPSAVGKAPTVFGAPGSH